MKRLLTLGVVALLAGPLLLGTKACSNTSIGTPHAASAGGGALVLVWKPAHAGSQAGSWRLTAAAGTAGALAGLMLADAIRPKVYGPQHSASVDIASGVNPRDPCFSKLPGFMLASWRLTSKIPSARLLCRQWRIATKNGSKVRFAKFINCVSKIIANGVLLQEGKRFVWKSDGGFVNIDDESVIHAVYPTHGSWKECGA